LNRRIFLATACPKPNPNWEPEAVLKEIGAQKLIGACANAGPWTRSGASAVESLKIGDLCRRCRIHDHSTSRKLAGLAKRTGYARR